MQTFLPYSNFEKTVKCLDGKRLNKQLIEAYQLLKIVSATSNGQRMYCEQCTGSNKILNGRLITSYATRIEEGCNHQGKLKPVPWVNHPATRMWYAKEDMLKAYICAVATELVSRFGSTPYRASVLSESTLYDWNKNIKEFAFISGYAEVSDGALHLQEAFHLSHRLNLLRKDIGYYGKLFADDLNNYPNYHEYDYIWPYVASAGFELSVRHLEAGAPIISILPKRDPKIQDRHLKLKPFDPFDL